MGILCFPGWNGVTESPFGWAKAHPAQPLAAALLIVRLKTPQNLSAQLVCPKVLDFNDKRLHWASVVRDAGHKNKTNLLLVDQTLLEMAVYKKKELDRA